MSKKAAQILQAFEALPEEEKRIFTVEFLRRAAPLDSEPLDHGATALVADQLLSEFETEESYAEPR